MAETLCYPASLTHPLQPPQPICDPGITHTPTLRASLCSSTAPPATLPFPSRHGHFSAGLRTRPRTLPAAQTHGTPVLRGLLGPGGDRSGSTGAPASPQHRGHEEKRSGLCQVLLVLQLQGKCPAGPAPPHHPQLSTAAFPDLPPPLRAVPGSEESPVSLTAPEGFQGCVSGSKLQVSALREPAQTKFQLLITF